MEKEELLNEIQDLYQQIDSTIENICIARINKDTKLEQGCIFNMESLMVDTLQDLTCIIDYFHER